MQKVRRLTYLVLKMQGKGAGLLAVVQELYGLLLGQSVEQRLEEEINMQK
jgi:hypothetical protein